MFLLIFNMLRLLTCHELLTCYFSQHVDYLKKTCWRNKYFVNSKFGFWKVEKAKVKNKIVVNMFLLIFNMLHTLTCYGL